MKMHLLSKILTGAGTTLSPSEASRLRAGFPNFDLGALIATWSVAPLTGIYLSLSKADDMSRLGAEMQWMTVDESLDESNNATPGIQAKEHGLVPIGKCLIGSGDPYFVNIKSESCEIVRVPHDMIDDNDRLSLDAIETVASSLESFLEKCLVSK